MKSGFILTFILLLNGFGLISCVPDKDQPSINDNRPDILKKLDGQWIGKGQVMGDSVEYRITGKPALNSMFTELHMIDVSEPPQYEALIYIGYDSISKKIYTHWLDSFGGAFSIPHGTGIIDDSKIEFSIPYSTAAFRDTFMFDKETESWMLTIESQVDSVTWKNFASYRIRKKANR